MEHLEEHPHAFILNNKVLWVGVFSGHDEPFLEENRLQLGADQVICCCNIGFYPSVDWTWDGATFTAPPQELSQEYLDWLANNPQ